MVQFMEFRIFEFSKLRIVAFFLKDFSLFDIERVAARFLWSWSIVALVSLYPCLVISTYGIQSFICVAHILSWLQIQSMWAFVLNNVHDEVIQNRFYCQWKFCWCCCYASAENGVLNIGSGSREGSPPLVRAHAVTKSIASTDDFCWGLYYEARTPEGATAYPCAGVHRRILASGEKWRARAYGRSNHRTRATALTANHYRIIISYISGENGALRANVCLFWFSKEDK